MTNRRGGLLSGSGGHGRCSERSEARAGPTLVTAVLSDAHLIKTGGAPKYGSAAASGQMIILRSDSEPPGGSETSAPAGVGCWPARRVSQSVSYRAGIGEDPNPLQPSRWNGTARG